MEEHDRFTILCVFCSHHISLYVPNILTTNARREIFVLSCGRCRARARSLLSIILSKPFAICDSMPSMVPLFLLRCSCLQLLQNDEPLVEQFATYCRAARK